MVLDEYHERSPHPDVALALSRQALSAHEYLALVVMSAALEVAPLAAFLGGCPVVEIAARSHPVSVEHPPEVSLAAAAVGVADEWGRLVMASSGEGDLIVDRARWQEYFDGYFVDGCAAMNDHEWFFLLRWEEDDDSDDPLPIRLLFVDARRALSERRFVRGSVNFSAMGVVSAPSSGDFVVVGQDAHAFRYDGSRGSTEVELPAAIPGSDLRAVVHAAGRIGSVAWAAGWPRRVWRRRAPGEWEIVSAGLPAPQHLGASDDIVKAAFSQRFRALAGFDERDVYVGGDEGELWHWDGVAWSRRAIAATTEFTAACAADDRVFLADATGALWVGRDREWSRLTDPAPYPIVDLAWFAGQLWCGHQTGGLDRLEGKRLVASGAPSEASPGLQHLDVAADGSCLLAAGRGGAALYDGRSWRALFGRAAPV